MNPDFPRVSPPIDAIYKNLKGNFWNINYNVSFQKKWRIKREITNGLTMGDAEAQKFHNSASFTEKVNMSTIKMLGKYTKSNFNIGI
jgi:hypothetical protein